MAEYYCEALWVGPLLARVGTQPTERGPRSNVALRRRFGSLELCHRFLDVSALLRSGAPSEQNLREERPCFQHHGRERRLLAQDNAKELHGPARVRRLAPLALPQAVVGQILRRQDI